MIIELKIIINYYSDTVAKVSEILPQKQNYIRCLRNIIKNCNACLDLPLNIDEVYQSGMVRLIDENQEILYKFIKGNLLPNERDFIKKKKRKTIIFQKLQ